MSDTSTTEDGTHSPSMAGSTIVSPVLNPDESRISKKSKKNKKKKDKKKRERKETIDVEMAVEGDKNWDVPEESTDVPDLELESMIHPDTEKPTKKKKKDKKKRKKEMETVEKDQKADMEGCAEEEEFDSKSASPLTDPNKTRISNKSKKKKRNKKHRTKEIEAEERAPVKMLSPASPTPDPELAVESTPQPEPLAYTFDPLSYASTVSTDPKAVQRHQHSYQGELLTHTYHTLPKNVRKFWKRRYQLFSKFDDGIYLNSELWYSVTPEDIAQYTAELFRRLLPNATSCADLCCGGGGNTIQFAKLFDSVGAIDINTVNLYCTAHNCEVYGTRDNVWMVEGDWNEMSELNEDGSVDYEWIKGESEGVDFIFSSPPWGGTGYDRDVYDLESMEPFPLTRMLTQLKRYTKNIGLFLPKLSDLDQLESATKAVFGDDAECRVEHLGCAVLALIGEELVQNYDEEQYEEEMEEEEEYDERYDEEYNEYEEGEFPDEEIEQEDEQGNQGEDPEDSAHEDSQTSETPLVLPPSQTDEELEELMKEDMELLDYEDI
ncbi:Trimethylguanosine synthase [Candida viswanathii]|uniref:Trimethylguanosine synthase n=1 Tax=Candida viswanathii TaxID=5486 RepID=A0A367XNU1_9ASCO|nr:Trimethylguanosine synthase [Candida viswanathii]